jgi:hypothetical protein
MGCLTSFLFCLIVLSKGAFGNAPTVALCAAPAPKELEAAPKGYNHGVVLEHRMRSQSHFSAAWWTLEKELLSSGSAQGAAGAESSKQGLNFWVLTPL